MSSPRKITLAEARDGGAIGLLVYCDGRNAKDFGCTHSGRIALSEAIARWGVARRLDDLPLYCSRCGWRDVDVRPMFTPHPSRG